MLLFTFVPRLPSGHRVCGGEHRGGGGGLGGQRGVQCGGQLCQSGSDVSTEIHSRTHSVQPPFSA